MLENENSICYAEYVVHPERKQVTVTITDIQYGLPEFQEWMNRIFHKSSFGRFSSLYVDTTKENPKRTTLVATYTDIHITCELLEVLDSWCLRTRDLRV